jgi:hypothetical protein
MTRCGHGATDSGQQAAVRESITSRCGGWGRVKRVHVPVLSQEERVELESALGGLSRAA